MKIPFPKLALVSLATGCCGLVTAFAIQAQGFPYPNGHCKSMPETKPHLPIFLRDIPLSEAQQDAVFSVLHQQAPTMRQNIKALHQARENLRTLTISGNYNEAEVARRVDSIAKILAKIEIKRAQTGQQLFRLLDEKQRHQAEVLLQEVESDEGHPPPGF